MKTYKLNMYGETYEIALLKGKYTSNETLAVQMVVVENGVITEPWSMLTVNIGDSEMFASETKAFIDTNNNGEEILEWLDKNQIAKFVGWYGQSGWCSYPLVAFNKELLSEMKEI